MILHEITQHNFETAVCSSLSEYFSLCDRYSLDYYRGLSVKGSFPVSPFGLTRSEAKADRDARGVGVPRIARVGELGDVLRERSVAQRDADRGERPAAKPGVPWRVLDVAELRAGDRLAGRHGLVPAAVPAYERVYGVDAGDGGDGERGGLCEHGDEFLRKQRD